MSNIRKKRMGKSSEARGARSIKEDVSGTQGEGGILILEQLTSQRLETAARRYLPLLEQHPSTVLLMAM